MGLLYFFETTMDVGGAQEQKFLKQWLEKVKLLAAETRVYEKESVKHLWKISGENKLVGVVDVPSPDVLDTCFASMPMKDQMNTSFTPMRPYEDFAADVWRWVGEKRDSAIVEGVKKAGLYYLLISDVEYEGVTQQELLRTWADEAIAAIESKKSGTILDLWKVVAERKVVVIICVKQPGELDRISFELPIMKKLGNQVSNTCKSVRHVTDWNSDLEKLAQWDY